MADSREGRNDPLYCCFFISKKSNKHGCCERLGAGKRARMAPNRQIIYDKTFWDEAKRREPDARRLDDLIDGALWAISTNPEKLPLIEKNLRVAFTDDFPGAPAM